MVPPRSPVTPPLIPIALRVGVTGHRPNRLRHADMPLLGATVRQIFETVQESTHAFRARTDKPQAYADAAPRLRVISPLAEGADRLVAEQGIRLGFELCCVMPFARPDFERDFAPPAALEVGSLNRFHDLLDQARRGPGLVTFELDGSRDDEGAAYLACGRVVVNQSDLLIAIWDRGDANGAGGTIQALQQAIHFQVPVVWIDAAAPHHWQLLLDESDLSALQAPDRSRPAAPTVTDWEALRAVVTNALDWPAAEATTKESDTKAANADLRSVYFRERRPRLNPAPFWKLFRNVIGDRQLRSPTLRIEDFETSVSAEWPTRADRAASELPDEPESVTEWINARLRPHFAWADRLADFYADKYRSSFVLAYPLAALAVLLALLPMAVMPIWPSAGFEVASVILELLTIFAILGLVFVGRHRRWHDRWMEYRVLAEVVRQLRLLLPLGGGRPLIRTPAHLETYGEPARTWMFAAMRALGRATGLPQARVDPAYVGQCLAHLAEMVDGQRHFHEINERRSERIEHSLHQIAFFLLMMTIVAIVLHLLPLLHVPGFEPLHQPAVSPWLVLGAAGLPALGAALAGISNQGEFSRVARRSRAMAERMKVAGAEISVLQARAAGRPAAVRLEHITPIAVRVMQLMVDENLDWRVVFTDRPPALPG